MTYNAGAPNQNQSPGIFPAQANTNFLRINDIVNSDHFFDLTATAKQGAHRRVRFLNLSGNPVTLDGSNSILYTKESGPGSQSQLWFYNGATSVQITPIATPPPTSGVQKIVSSAVIVSGGSFIVYNSTGNVQLTAFLSRNGELAVNSYSIATRTSSSGSGKYIKVLSGNGSNFPILQWNGNSLEIFNPSSQTKTIDYFLTVVSA